MAKSKSLIRLSAVVGLLGVTERLAKEAEEEDTSIFFAQLFDRQLARQRAAVEAFAVDQIKVIDNGRNTVKRRRAVAFFVKHFPVRHRHSLIPHLAIR